MVRAKMRQIVKAIITFIFSVFTHTNVIPKQRACAFSGLLTKHEQQKEVLTRLAGNSVSLILKRRAKRTAPIALPVFGPRTKAEQLAARNAAMELLANRSAR